MEPQKTKWVKPNPKMILETMGWSYAGPLPGEQDFLLNPMLDKLESGFIRYALIECRGHKTDTAALLGIKRSTLVMRMKRLRMPLERKNYILPKLPYGFEGK